MTTPAAALTLSREDPAARAGMYRLLARLWEREVDADLVAMLSKPAIRECFQEAGGVVPDDDEASLEGLAIDYCRLFVGPKGHLPPFQSVWQDGQFEGHTTDSMRAFADLVPSAQGRLQHGSMVDHFAIQLRYEADVLQQIAATTAGSEEADLLWELAEAFFAAHLMWPEELLNLSESRAETDFYRSLSGITRRFLNSECPRRSGCA